MNNIKDLSDEEIRLLCKAIGVPALKRFYKDRPKHFAKICPGFRADKLSADKIIDLTVKNRNQEFIRRFLSLHKNAILAQESREDFAQLMNLQIKIASAESRLTILQIESEDRQSKVDDADARLAVLRHDCADYESRLETAKEKLAGVTREGAALEAQIDFYRRTLAELAADIQQKEKFYADLQSDISKAKTVFDSLRDFIGDEKKKILSKTKYYRLGSENLFVPSIEEMFSHAPDFVKHITTAYKNNIPLLLAGSRAHEIADAISITFTASTAAIFDCAQVNCLDDLNVCKAIDNKIIVLINPLAPNFIAYLPELLSITGKYFMALHPFAEDLLIEPRGLFDYFAPVLTELYLKKNPNEKFMRDAFDEMRELLGAAE